MREVYKTKKGYEMMLFCDTCNDVIFDNIEALDIMHAKDVAFEITNELGWRWFGGFHKCKECISQGKNYARGKNYEH